MRLMLQLIARLLAVVLLCLGAVTIWAMFDAYRSVDRATAASAERVSQAGPLLAGTLVAQQQDARTAPAGARMAHHRNDEIDLTRRLHPIAAQDRIRETALWSEQGHR